VYLPNLFIDAPATEPHVCGNINILLRTKKRHSVLSTALIGQSGNAEPEAAGGRVDAVWWLHDSIARGRPNLRLGLLHSRTIMFLTLPNRDTAVLLMLYDLQDAEHPHSRAPLER
jgi:hypothetical protein